MRALSITRATVAVPSLRRGGLVGRGIALRGLRASGAAFGPVTGAARLLTAGGAKRCARRLRPLLGLMRRSGICLGFSRGLPQAPRRRDGVCLSPAVYLVPGGVAAPLGAFFQIVERGGLRCIRFNRHTGGLWRAADVAPILPVDWVQAGFALPASAGGV